MEKLAMNYPWTKSCDFNCADAAFILKVSDELAKFLIYNT